MSIRCNSKTAEKLASRMLGSMGRVNPHDVPDAIAEICNRVAGNFKSKVSELAEHCMLSAPAAIRGENDEMVTVSYGERINVVLAYDGAPA